MKLTCLNFIPTDEQLSLIRDGSHDAQLDLAYHHNILFLPLLFIWYQNDGERDNQDVEAYRCGYIDAETCRWRLPAPLYQQEVSTMAGTPESATGSLVSVGKRLQSVRGWPVMAREENEMAPERRLHGCDDESHEDCWSVYEFFGDWETSDHRYIADHVSFYVAYELVFGQPFEHPNTIESE